MTEAAKGTREGKQRKRSQMKEIWRRMRRNKLAMAGLSIVVVLILVAIFADQIADYDTQVIRQDVMNRYQGPSAEHWCGTDELGRDIFARLVHGARISLLVGVAAVCVALATGGVLGAIAGYFGGAIDNIIMRIMDVFMAFPQILLAILLTSIFGQDLKNAIIAVGICTIPNFARTSRGETLSIRSSEYVEAARALGARSGRIIFSHVMINVVSPLIVMTTLNFGNAIITTAGMGFLGVGAQPPTPEWGAMLSNGRQFLLVAPHICTITGLVIMVLVLGLNLFGDGLRDVLDPRLKD